ncbi:MAG: SUMF1/EgtB/PvdO family nonheme iron enzyme [Bacteroidota bacterium]
MDAKSELRPGKDYALLFAVRDYEDKNWTKLKNPIHDLKSIELELKEMYAFEVVTVINPKKHDILSTLKQWQQKSFSNTSQLFVFFSGHGTFSEFKKKGFFIPSDGKFHDPFNESHIDLSDIGNIVSQIPCNHILLSIDACYSGTIDREIAFKGKPAFNRPKWEQNFDQVSILIDRQLRNNSKLLITSGGKERTPDGDKHSPFSGAIIRGLRSAYTNGNGILLFADLLAQFERVSPTPHMGELEGHEDGGFVFVTTQMPEKKVVENLQPQPQISKYDIPNLPIMKEVEGGKFLMGADAGNQDEQPLHEVNINSFYISITEITNEQFCMFLNAKGNDNWLELGSKYCKIYNSGQSFRSEKGFEKHPIVEISWNGAKAYCSWLSETTGQNFRLPSEAEWEYAAGGGSEDRTKWAGTNHLSTLSEFANQYGKGKIDSYDQLAPVASFNANSLGLYDMSGNVAEWCLDSWHPDYYGSPADNKAWIDKNQEEVVIRGGSWFSRPNELRTSYRNHKNSNTKTYGIGFRVVKIH